MIRAPARVAAWPLPGAWPPLAVAPDWRPWLERAVRREIDQRRLFPWIAVSFGLGIILFFQADGTPALWAPGLGLCVSGIAAIGLRRNLAGLAAALAFAALFAGFGAAALRMRSLDGPVLARVLITTISGFVESVDERPDGRRVVLRVTSVQGLPESRQPHRIRVSVRKDVVVPGQFIEGRARLLPPPAPSWPGGYDFARDASFKEIGGVGAILGGVRSPPPPGAMPFDLRLAALVDAARGALTQRVAASIGGQPGAVGAALVTGKRGLIDDGTNAVLRGAGIYHVVSISGLHMVLAAGTVFWLARAILALVPGLAIGWPVKKIAAGVAMVGAVLYCVFSGSEVATERSLVMTLVMFGAILVDRPAMSIRNLAVAALVVLAREPEALLGPGFQMSYGAVAALVAAAPLLKVPVDGGGAVRLLDRGFRWIANTVVGLLGTTIVATLATSPFTAYHFQSLNPLGLIGNALALPLVSAVVMPSAVFGVLAYPFGLDRPIWQMMGWAVARVLDVAAWVNGLTGSTVTVPAMSVTAIGLMGLALLIVTLLASSLRWIAVVPALTGLALAATPERFDVFVDREGAGAMVRGPDGRLAILGKPSRFVMEQWLRADGDSRDPRDPSLRRGTRCDPGGCVAQAQGGRFVALDTDVAALEEDCRRAAIVVTRLTALPGCAATLILDRESLETRGATTLRLTPDGIRLKGVRQAAETIPWAKSPPGPAKEPVVSKPAPLTEEDLDDDGVSSDEPG
ncbi:MAG: ComEC/Rec2 family competence protein [Microvirga sp.]